MTDKDQFTFDDDGDFPETERGERTPLTEVELNDDELPETDLGDRTLSPEAEFNDDEFSENDLSAAFSDGEHSAADMTEDVSATTAQGDGNSRTRMLLMILLLVVAGGAGVYYFMDIGGTTPAVPTVAVPAQSASKSVALPPQPASEPATPVPTEQVTTPVTVAVPPPPPEPAGQEAPVTQPAEKVVAEQPAAEAAKPAAAPEAATQEQAAAKPEPASAAAVATILPAETAKAEMPVPSAMQVEGGAYALDAGSYLLESNRDQLVKKIKKLGYEPLVTPVDATLDMTRLRLGTFSKDEVQEALAIARTIEPGSYSAPAGDLYVIYAGTFMKSGNIDKLTRRFLAEGIVVHPEPVQVVRTLSRVRFGSFASKEDAAAAAHEIAQAGIKAAVVKSK